MILPSNTPPTLPPLTCQLINKAIKRLRKASDPDCDMVAELLADAQGLLEEIREANSQLRDAVEWWKDAAEARQEHIDQLEARFEQINRLESEAGK